MATFIVLKVLKHQVLTGVPNRVLCEIGNTNSIHSYVKRSSMEQIKSNELL